MPMYETEHYSSHCTCSDAHCARTTRIARDKLRQAVVKRRAEQLALANCSGVAKQLLHVGFDGFSDCLRVVPTFQNADHLSIGVGRRHIED